MLDGSLLLVSTPCFCPEIRGDGFDVSGETFCEVHSYPEIKSGDTEVQIHLRLLKPFSRLLYTLLYPFDIRKLDRGPRGSELSSR